MDIIAHECNLINQLKSLLDGCDGRDNAGDNKDGGSIAISVAAPVARGLSHAMARTHIIISNQPASPKTLAKSTAIGPKATRNRNGFMRIGIWFPLSLQYHQSSAPYATGVEAWAS